MGHQIRAAACYTMKRSCKIRMACFIPILFGLGTSLGECHRTDMTESVAEGKILFVLILLLLLRNSAGALSSKSCCGEFTGCGLARFQPRRTDSIILLRHINLASSSPLSHCVLLWTKNLFEVQCSRNWPDCCQSMKLSELSRILCDLLLPPPPQMWIAMTNVYLQPIVLSFFVLHHLTMSVILYIKLPI